MNKETLTTLMRARGLSQAELARRAGVSRQAVSLWFKQSEDIRVTGAHLVAVAKALRKPVDQLITPLPLRGSKLQGELRARLLWDRLYPTLDDFAIALNQGEPRAVARLVETHGLYAAAKVAGKARVWRDFPDYSRFIPPIRRRQLQCLWSWKTNRPSS